MAWMIAPGLKILASGEAAKNCWDTFHNPSATTGEKAFGVVKGVLSLTTIAGPVARIANATNLANTTTRTLTVLDSVSNVSMGVLAVSTSAITAMKVYNEVHRGKIPVNAHIIFLFTTLGFSIVFGTVGLTVETVNALGSEKIVNCLASYLIEGIPFAISKELIIHFSEKQCLELSNKIIEEFVAILNAATQTSDGAAKLAIRKNEVVAFLRAIRKVPQLLKQLLEVAEKKLADAIHGRGQVVLITQQAGLPAPAAQGAGASLVDYGLAIHNAKYAAFKRDCEQKGATAVSSEDSHISEADLSSAGITQEDKALFKFGLVSEFLDQNKDVAEAIYKEPANKQKALCNGVFAKAIANAFTGAPAAEILLRSNHPGQKYVCALCRKEIVEPKVYFIYPGTEIRISTLCLSSRKESIYTINEQKFSRETFVFENRINELEKLKSFRASYQDMFVKLIKGN